MNLENLETKEPIIKDFFIWLFDDDRFVKKDVCLVSEIDLTLASYYMDANIYYPKQIANFFNTKAMQRLGRISQLDLVIDQFPNVYHNRLEHSKGVYYRKLEEMLHNFQNPIWKKQIENDKMKPYLLAELIKMAGHDIGHFPLSHVLECEILGCRGAHEIIGQRIMLENVEIQSVLKSISPNLPHILKELYDKPVLNFQAHDESSYDVDRLDYIFRDNLYAGNPIFIPYSHYKTVGVTLNDSGVPSTDFDGSIITSSKHNATIDVYQHSSLPNIEHFLETRVNGYKNMYFSLEAHIRENTIGIFFKAFLASGSQFGNKLRNYINAFHTCNINDIDLRLFLEWDDIKFYSNILEIAENHEDSNVRLLATMIIPNMNNFLTMIYSHLSMYTKSKNYTQEDKEFLQKLKLLIKGNSELSQNLKDPNFIVSNTLVFTPEKDLPSSYENYINNGFIQSSSLKITAYKKNEPIYIFDINGKIYELSSHPDRKYDWESKISYIKSKYAYIPFLKLHGMSDAEIEQMRNHSHYPLIKNCEITSKKVNMQPLQVSHNIDDYFLEL